MRHLLRHDHPSALLPRLLSAALLLATLACTAALSPASAARGEEIRTIDLKGWIGGLAFAPDGKQLVAGVSDNTAVLLDTTTSKTVRVFSGHKDYVIGVAISPDGKRLGTASYDHTAGVWDLATGKRLLSLEGHRGVVMTVAFAPDGATLATGSLDTEIRLWNGRSGDLLSVLKGHKSWVNSLVFTPDGKQIVSGSSDGTVAVWDVATGKQLQSLRATKAEVRSVAVSPDGRQIAAGLRYGQVKTWNTADWKLQLDFQEHREDVFAVTYINNQVLATGDGGWNRPGEVKLWNAQTGKQLAEHAHSGEVLSLAASRDGHALSAGSGDGAVRIWRLAPPAAGK